MAPEPTTPGPTLSAAHDVLLLDLDGVLYVGAGAVPHAVDALAAAAAGGTPALFVTNNASRTPDEVAGQLTALGVPARPEQVTTSSQAGALLVAQHAGDAASVLAVGGPGVRAALVEAGLRVLARPEDRPDAVLQGFGRQVGWTDLCDVVVAVQAGALWVATNTDLTIPTERGLMPGNGSLIGVVRRAVAVDPLVAGKPERAIFDAAAARAGAARPLVVGDRLDTDIAGAVAAEMPALLVLTGVSGPQDAFAAPPAHRPTYVGADLRALAEPHVPLGELPREDGAWVLRGARATVDDGLVTTTGAAGDDLDGLLDQVRVALAAAWSLPVGAARPDDRLASLLAQVRRRCVVRP